MYHLCHPMSSSSFLPPRNQTVGLLIRNNGKNKDKDKDRSFKRQMGEKCAHYILKRPKSTTFLPYLSMEVYAQYAMVLRHRKALQKKNMGWVVP